MGRKGLMTSDMSGLLLLMAFRIRGFRAKITHRPVGLGLWQSKQNGLLLSVTSLLILSVRGKNHTAKKEVPQG
jgi:hypothetical protein